jgi:hypothetical protein
MLYSSKDDCYIDTNYYVNRYNKRNNIYLGRRCFGNILLLIPIGYCGILFYMYING